MVTVLRDENGKIRYVRGEGNYFLSIKDRDILLDTVITPEMITNTFQDGLSKFANILNGDSNIELIKIRILNNNGHNIVIREIN